MRLSAAAQSLTLRYKYLLALPVLPLSSPHELLRPFFVLSGMGSPLLLLESFDALATASSIYKHLFHQSPPRTLGEVGEEEDLPLALCSQSGLVPLTIKSPRPASYKRAPRRPLLRT